MPRRRKKSTLERKPSLVFTESPVNIQNNVLTPVLCARHPPTASSIPIENLNNLSWVSPQFQNVPSSDHHGRHRNTRQRRHSVASHRNLLNSHGLNKENHSHSNQMTKLKKFNSLRFVGERTCVSVLEEVDVTIETDTPAEEEHRDDNRISMMSSPNSGAKHSHHGAMDFVDNRVNNVSLDEDSVLSEDLGSIHPMQLKAPVKRLFASQLGTFQSNSFCDPPNESISSERVIHDNFSAQIQSQVVLESEEESPIPLRRSARIQQLQSLLNMSDSPYLARNLRKILAPDTPENEYGWSKRKRQLIKYIKKTS